MAPQQLNIALYGANPPSLNRQRRVGKFHTDVGVHHLVIWGELQFAAPGDVLFFRPEEIDLAERR